MSFAIANAVETDVKYKVFCGLKDSGYDVCRDNLTDVNIDKNLPTKVFVHGWNSTGTSSWYDPLKNEYLKRSEHNIIFVDWSKANGLVYTVVAANTKPVGNFIGQFLLDSGIDLGRIHIVGHSLGSHVAGFVGKYVFEKTNEKIFRITATDPASPVFEHPEVDHNSRLSENDARFVDVIHTDIGGAGFTKPIGHVDFYANGGKNQPGCGEQDRDGKEKYT